MFPSHLPCERRDAVEFAPLAEQPAEAFKTLGFGMVYLPASESERGTHVCAKRPCALAPVLRQFIQVEVRGENLNPRAWLRVDPKIEVKTKEQP